jgi:hypothetical protein
MCIQKVSPEEKQMLFSVRFSDNAQENVRKGYSLVQERISLAHVLLLSDHFTGLLKQARQFLLQAQQDMLCSRGRLFKDKKGKTFLFMLRVVTAALYALLTNSGCQADFSHQEWSDAMFQRPFAG